MRGKRGGVQFESSVCGDASNVPSNLIAIFVVSPLALMYFEGRVSREGTYSGP